MPVWQNIYHIPDDKSKTTFSEMGKIKFELTLQIHPAYLKREESKDLKKCF